MIGAIWTVGVLAFLCSMGATIGNFAMARDFPDFTPEDDTNVLSDFLLDSKVAFRYAQFKLMTNIFYYQALMLWTVLGVLVAYTFLVSWFA
jgi:hypothetical protein